MRIPLRVEERPYLNISRLGNSLRMFVRYLCVADEVSVVVKLVPEGLCAGLTAKVEPQVVLLLPCRGSGRRNEGKDRPVQIGKLNSDHMLPVLRFDSIRILRGGSNGMKLLCTGK